ncbi:MAG: IS200/IS605 family transposase [Chloroflexi bacterium]|nr:IS200/IS605 family transposase [Chloroflexota bacterium]
MPYWKLYYHIVWGTKNGFDFISPAWEKDLYDYLWGKAIALECIPHTINGMPNHLHVVLSVPPKLALAKTIGLLKGSSSHHINENYLDHTFAWQAEYGIFSFAEKSLSKIVSYVQNQKKHHDENTLYSYMEEWK